MTYIDPYHKLGLRRNPFIAPENLEIPSQLWLDFGVSQSPPIANKLFIQIIGEKGAGKTSHLLHWQQETGGIYYYCQPDYHRWQLPPVQAIAYWDEADRIPLFFLFISLLKARFLNATIVVGTHKNLKIIPQLLGLKIETIILTTLNINNLLKWVEKHLEKERLSSTTPILWRITPVQAEEIVAKSQKSWRKAANYLHILLAKMAKNVNS